MPLYLDNVFFFLQNKYFFLEFSPSSLIYILFLLINFLKIFQEESLFLVKLNNLVITSFTTLGNGISNYTAQNIGAGKLERIKNGFFAGLKLVWILCVPLIIIYFFAGKYLLYMFMDEPTIAATKSGINFLRILSPFYFVISAKLVADGILRGAGMMNKFMIATLTDLILRVVLAIVLAKTSLGSNGIWCAWPIGWSVAAILSIKFYHSGKWYSQEKNS